MPLYKFKTSFDLPKKFRAFLRFEGGVTRGLLPSGFASGSGGGIKPENIVWVFGAGRTGSTWISEMMEEIQGHEVWFEPRVGACFNPEDFRKHDGRHFFFSSDYREVWLRSVRSMVLDGANARFPDLGDGHLFIKEPGGSQGAPVLMEALPESRMVLLVRDPRDVVSSWLDAARKGGWQSKELGLEQTAADVNPNAFVQRHANSYLKGVGNAKRAYEQHTGYKTLVRYEDLRRETLSTMQRMYRELGISVDERALGEAVEKHSWERIPQEKKGEGKFYRKGVAGGWREDLTQRQVEIVERITRPLIDEFYPD